MNLQAGTPIDRYVIQDVLGQGGMATVYRVKHAILGTQHALKVLHQASATIAERLIREGQLQARLDPNLVVPVHDVLMVNGSPALLMPFVRGCSLADLLRTYTPTDGEAAFILLGVARGLAAAHENGIIHRDLKPANVLLEVRHGRLVIRVADFGIARMEAGSLETRAGALLGTLAYAAPEQLEDASSVDARADVWSFGVMAYEMLCGVLPFSANERGSILIKVLSGKYDASCIPEAWRPFIASMIAVDPQERPADGAALVTELDRRSPSNLDLNSPLFQVLHEGAEANTDVISQDTMPTLAMGMSHTDPTLGMATSPEPAGLPAPSATAPYATPSPERAPATADLESLPPLRTNLPAERDAFIGRTDELNLLHEQVTSGAALLTLLGVGGTGKTRLALHYGRGHLDEWPGGVWFVDLTDATSANGIFSAVAAAFDIPLGKSEPTQLLGRALSGRGKLLIIIDNVEHLVAHARPILTAWLDQAPETVFIATSRVVLDVRGEQTWAVPPLKPLTARKLFISRAMRAKVRFSPSDDDIRTIDALVEKLDHLPLAVELAAARIRMMTPQKMLARIGERFRLLSSKGGETNRHRTLRAALDWSWDLLTDWEKAALAQCSVFEGGFDLEAAESILDISDYEDAPWPMDAVQSLVDKSLVRAKADDRFGLLVSVQAYAKERLNQMDFQEEVEIRHGTYYAEFGTEDALRALDRHNGVALTNTLHNDLDNVVMAWRRACSRGDTATATNSASAFCRVLLTRGPYLDAISVLKTSLALEGLSIAERARLSEITGRAYRVAGHREQATPHLERAIQLYGELDDRAGIGRALLELGFERVRAGELGPAKQDLERGLALFIEAGDRAGQADALSCLGALARKQGDYELNQAHNRKALAIAKTLGATRLEASVLISMANAYAEQNRFKEATASYFNVLKTFQDTHDRHGKAVIYINLGHIYLKQRQYEKAEETYQKGLSTSREIANPYLEWMATLNLADIKYLRSDLAAAESLLRTAEAQARDQGEYSHALTLTSYARLYARQGHHSLAEEAMQRAEPIIRKAGNHLQTTTLLATKATILALAGNRPSGQAALEEALSRKHDFKLNDALLSIQIDEARAALERVPGPTK